MIHKDRLEREAQTLRAMFLLYCRLKHSSKTKLCSECQDLQDYSLERLYHCRFGQDKTVCAKCPVHCYKPEMRMKIKEVMRSAGPFMLFLHPLLTIQHYLDGLEKKAPLS